MKKVIFIILIAASLGLSACGGKSNESNGSNTVVADSAGNAGTGQGEPTQGAVSSGAPTGSPHQDSTTTKAHAADENQ